MEVEIVQCMRIFDIVEYFMQLLAIKFSLLKDHKYNTTMTSTFHLFITRSTGDKTFFPLELQVKLMRSLRNVNVDIVLLIFVTITKLASTTLYFAEQN